MSIRDYSLPLLALVLACQEPLAEPAALPAPAPGGAPAVAAFPACTRHWKASASGSWGMALNWNPVGVPGAADVACIDAPGSYTVSVQPRSALPMVQCAGTKQTAVVKVAAPAKTAAAAAAPAPACPDGWKLDAKSVNKKTGAFTCTAKAGTALPASKLACAAPLGYFENSSKGQLGCRP